MELHKLHIHNFGPSTPSHRHATARRALGIGCLAVEAPRAARSQHHCRSAQHDLFPVINSRSPVATAFVYQQIHDITMLERLNIFLFSHKCIETACYLGTSRITMRMHNAVAAVAALASQRQRAVGIRIELSTVIPEHLHIAGTFLGHDGRDVTVRKARPRHQRIRQMQFRIIIGPKGSRNAPLCLVRVAIE